MFFPELIDRRRRVGIAAAPELFNKGVSLVVRVEFLEDGPFFVDHDVANVFLQPFLVVIDLFLLRLLVLGKTGKRREVGQKQNNRGKRAHESFSAVIVDAMKRTCLSGLSQFVFPMIPSVQSRRHDAVEGSWRRWHDCPAINRRDRFHNGTRQTGRPKA